MSNENIVVKVENISDFDFTPEMGAQYGGVAYPLSAGQSQLLPHNLGHHLAKHLARQIIIREAPISGSKEDQVAGTLFNEGNIQALIGKIVANAYEEEPEAIKTPESVLKKKVNELNRETDTPVTPQEYKDKREVIDELNKRDIQYDARKSKDKLEELLK